MRRLSQLNLSTLIGDSFEEKNLWVSQLRKWAKIDHMMPWWWGHLADTVEAVVYEAGDDLSSPL